MQSLNLKVGTTVRFSYPVYDSLERFTDTCEIRIGKITAYGKGGSYIIYSEEVLDEGIWVMAVQGYRYTQKFHVFDTDVLAYGKALEVIYG